MTQQLSLMKLFQRKRVIRPSSLRRLDQCFKEIRYGVWRRIFRILGMLGVARRIYTSFMSSGTHSKVGGISPFLTSITWKTLKIDLRNDTWSVRTKSWKKNTWKKKDWELWSWWKEHEKVIRDCWSGRRKKRRRSYERSKNNRWKSKSISKSSWITRRKKKRRK